MKSLNGRKGPTNYDQGNAGMVRLGEDGKPSCRHQRVASQGAKEEEDITSNHGFSLTSN